MSKKPRKKNPAIRRAVYRYLRLHAGKSFSEKKIQREFAGKYSTTAIREVLDWLVTAGTVSKDSNGRYSVAGRGPKLAGQTVTGILDLTPAGNAYVICENLPRDIFIRENKVNRAFDGDLVKVALYKTPSHRKPQGEIVEIIQRNREYYVGTVQLYRQHAFVVPDYKRVNVDFFIPEGRKLGLKEGQRVVVRIAQWKEGDKNPVGEIIEQLGVVGDNDTEMKSILVQNGFPIHFPEKVLDEAAKAAESVSPKEFASRRDFRDIPTFTIDPEDAKDFDDALSLRDLGGQRYEVGIHIADVSYFVKPGTALDKEAYKRATSVYLVDRVLPMLPESLSNLTCSLRPGEEKLCFSAVFVLDQNARILEEWFGRTVIKSDKRFTYEEAQEVIETGQGPFVRELRTLNRLAAKLREEKFKNGAIAFETAEVQFKVDMDGVPIGVAIKERKETHLLIEDFMLLANRRVAAWAAGLKPNGKEVPFVYRVHDEPDSERLQDFSNFARLFGYELNIDTPARVAESLNRLMEQVKGKPEQNALEQLAIRSMAKAVYTTRNIGHYGLAFKHYTHFTSPIRRYPDILVHRLLADYLAGQFRAKADALESQCLHCSVMERKAMEAERESVKLKQVEYLEKHIGESFDGIITGVMPFGLFVELLENKCEGLVPIDSLDDDFYIFEDRGNRLVGAETGHTWKLGDPVRVQLTGTDREKRQIDFVIDRENRQE